MKLPLGRLSTEFGIQPGVVIHAGANLCQEREEYANSPFGPIVWIEALDNVIEEARALLLSYPGQSILRGVLWSESGVRLPFNISSNNAESSSILEFKWHQALHPHVAAHEKIYLESQTLDELLTVHFGSIIPEISLLVLDLQGVEFEALQGAELVLRHVKAIHVEVSTVELYKEQKLLKDVTNLLHQFGFILVDHDLSKGVFSGDALFISNSLPVKLVRLEPMGKRLFPKVSIRYWFKYFLLRLGVPAETIQRCTSHVKRILASRGK